MRPCDDGLPLAAVAYFIEAAVLSSGAGVKPRALDKDDAVGDAFCV